MRIQCLTHPFACESKRAFKARPPSPGSAPGDAARPSGSRMLTIRTKNTTGDRPVRRRHQARAFPVWGGAQCTERRWRPECVWREPAAARRRLLTCSMPQGRAAGTVTTGGDRARKLRPGRTRAVPRYRTVRTVPGTRNASIAADSLPRAGAWTGGRGGGFLPRVRARPAGPRPRRPGEDDGARMPGEC